MKASTSAWLAPMETAAKERGLDLAPFMAEATVPLGETGLSFRLAGAMESVEGVGVGAIDWVKYGRLVREALGPAWQQYPDAPEDEG